MTEYDLKRLEKAVKILSDAEKQLKHSSDHFSLLTAALLQIASGKHVESTQQKNYGKYATTEINNSIKKSSAFSSRSPNSIALRDSGTAIVPSIMSGRPTPSVYHTSSGMVRNQGPISAIVPTKIQSVKGDSSDDALLVYNATQNSLNLSEIWRRCIEKCYSEALRQLLSVHGKLISLTESEG